MREHIGLVGPGESLDRGAVETEALGERPLDLCRGDRHALQGADDIGEPEADELDAPLFDSAKNEVTLLVHQAPLIHSAVPRAPVSGY
jgi:hypothetical protein